eukprot:TRINITY_DN4110_c0_g1_i1.p2 TRINITY_DN4110_c0_g1~~TRINITY_DN4110_c0_g1_i1.p2  ORF type:complete len:588 (-),score=257.17 TRINITY_DN4110_c0_g1_i1:56-1750(-)
MSKRRDDFFIKDVSSHRSSGPAKNNNNNNNKRKADGAFPKRGGSSNNNGKAGQKYGKKPARKAVDEEIDDLVDEDDDFGESRDVRRQKAEEDMIGLGEMPDSFNDGSIAELRSAKRKKTVNEYLRAQQDAEADRIDAERETADEKRLRLARDYLAKLEKASAANASDSSASDSDEDEEVDEDDEDDLEAELALAKGPADKDSRISQKLANDWKQAAGKIQRDIADEIKSNSESIVKSVRVTRGHHQSTCTCVCLTNDEQTAYTGSVDSVISQWDMETGVKTRFAPDALKKKKSSIYALSVSADGRHLASASNKEILIWDARSDNKKPVHTFAGHRGAVSALGFRKGQFSQLFSASFDRCLKLWNVDDFAYVETFYGHTGDVSSLDVGKKERVVTGGKNGTVRLWKVLEESQLLFQGHTSSVDSVKFLSEDTFVSGSQDGSIAVWGAWKKTPLAKSENAHGFPQILYKEEGEKSKVPRWITSVGACFNSDLFASGSYDGNVRLWKYQKGSKHVTSLISVPVEGVVNEIVFGKSGRVVVAAVGKEHRHGRWFRETSAKNGLAVFTL